MDSPTSSRESLSPVPSLPSPTNRVKDPDFLPPNLDLGGKAPVPSSETLTTPVNTTPPAAYDQKLVSRDRETLFQLVPTMLKFITTGARSSKTV